LTYCLIEQIGRYRFVTSSYLGLVATQTDFPAIARKDGLWANPGADRRPMRPCKTCPIGAIQSVGAKQRKKARFFFGFLWNGSSPVG
jgi:hypothetical protein